MAHADKPQWSDFYENDPQLGPLLPLTSGQRVQLISGVLPSGESRFLTIGSYIHKDKKLWF